MFSSIRLFIDFSVTNDPETSDSDSSLTISYTEPRSKLLTGCLNWKFLPNFVLKFVVITYFYLAFTYFSCNLRMNRHPLVTSSYDK